ncbi:MAG: leucine-rich repeat domain-containing protein [Verrucomicrobia bacterium]|nr:leucine-rich repeat domain-containing protein [Verrucomicrobiota bacterium]MBI3869944.1 leucine-rich repeat domain-containing protein [Verrucomicrobiota bacterium]
MRKGKLNSSAIHAALRFNACPVQHWSRLLLPLFSLLVLLGTTADAAQHGDFVFESSDSGAIITGYLGSGGDVTVPDRLNGQPVTRIGFEAFAHVINLNFLSMPVGVSEIESHAFLGCAGLRSVSFSRTLAFIDPGAFIDCDSLTVFEVDGLNPDYASADGVLFDKARAVLLQFPPGKEGAYAVPQGVTTISGAAFQSCRKLTSITLPQSAKSIEGIGFSDCVALQAIEVDSLNSVYSGVDGVLLDKAGTKVLTCPQGRAGDISLPNTVTDIGELALFGCSRLTSIALPNSLTSIGNSAFARCAGLSSLTVPGHVTDIGYGVFQGCSLLKKVYFEGDAPESGEFFDAPSIATIYHKAEAKGWGDVFADQPTAIWTTLSGYAAWVQSSGLGARYPNASGEGDDPDGDGLVNRDEWAAGTDPTQADSVLALELTPRPADLVDADRTAIPDGYHALYFRSVPGHRYGARMAPRLGGEWEQQAVAVASTTQTRFLVPKPAKQGFYRVVVLP